MLIVGIATLFALAAGVWPCHSAPAKPAAPALRLEAAGVTRVKDVHVFDASLLPDNETVVLVGTNPVEVTDEDPAAQLRTTEPAGALVNLRTKATTKFLNGHTSPIQSVAVSPDGRRIATTAKGTDPKVRIWDTKRGQLGGLDISELVKEHDRPRVTYLWGDNRLAVTLNKQVSVFTDGKAGSIDFTHPVFSHLAVRRPAVSNGDRYLAVSTRKQVIVWEMASQKSVLEAEVVPEGIDDPEQLSVSDVRFGHRSDILYLARHWPKAEVPKGTNEADVPAARRGVVAIDVERKKVTPLAMGAQHHTYHLAIHPTDDWLALAGVADPDKPLPSGIVTVGEIRVYHIASGVLSARIQTGDYYPMWVEFTSNGQTLVAVNANGEIRTWSFVVGKQ
jgi:WD40 repeat protein